MRISKATVGNKTLNHPKYVTKPSFDFPRMIHLQKNKQYGTSLSAMHQQLKYKATVFMTQTGSKVKAQAFNYLQYFVMIVCLNLSIFMS